MPTLREHAASAGKWSAVATFARLLTSYGLFLVVAPFMSVEEFGLFSLVLMVVNLGQVLSEAGLRDAVVYKSELTAEVFSSIFWLCCFIALSVFVVVQAAAPALGDFFQFADLDTWIHVAAPIATALAIGAPYQAVLEKEFLFRPLAIIEVMSGLVGLGLSVIWVVLGSPFAAILGGLTLRAVVRTGLLFAAGNSRVTLKWHFSLSALGGAGRFGAFRTLDAVVGLLLHRADRVLIAYLLGQEALGVYAFAWHIAVDPMQRLAPIFTQVLFPALSKIDSNPARVAKAYCKGLKVIGATSLPIVGSVAVCAPAVVPLLFGRQWDAAVPLIEILCIAAVMRVVVAPVGTLLMSRGRPDINLYWNFGTSVLAGAGVTGAALMSGLLGVVTTLAGLYVLFFLAHPTLLVRPVLPELQPSQIMRATAAPLFLSCTAAVIAIAVGHFGIWTGWVEVAIQLIVAGGVYVGGFLIIDREFVRESSALLIPRLSVG
jgi:lipopolysaccharide exporter